MVQSHFYVFFQNKIFFFSKKHHFSALFFLIAHGARPPVVTTDSYLTPPRSARLSRISLARLYAAPRLASHCAIPLTTARHQADTSTAHWWTFVMHNAHVCFAIICLDDSSFVAILSHDCLRILRISFLLWVTLQLSLVTFLCQK